MGTPLTEFLDWWITFFEREAFKRASDVERSLRDVPYDDLPTRFVPGLKSWRRCSKARRKVVASRLLKRSV
jgi:hypothetical protein